MAADVRPGATLDDLVAVAERTDGGPRLAGGAPSAPITSITHDSREVAAGAMFACLRGDRFDGHEFAGDAVRAGATALLTDHELDPDVDGVRDVPQLVVDDTRRRLGPLAAEVYGRPSEAMVTVGITGTNGKTTTAHLLAAVFEAHGWPCGVVGTLHGPRTTPEAPELQATLAGFVDEGRTSAVLEVSSHALALHRIDGTRFDAVVFTNFGRDHLDLHGTQEEYFRAKASLFTPGFSSLAVVNGDDTHGRLLLDSIDGEEMRTLRFGLEQVEQLEVGPDRHSYVWRGTPVEVAIGGAFNVFNSLAALTTATELGVPADTAAAALAGVGQVPGRFQTIRHPDPEADVPVVVVDYAHTPDGLVEVLTSARSVVAPGASVVAVFGCGGERDREKRPEMGAAAARLADHVVVTSDNPRSEDPQAIIDDVLRGVETGYRARVTANPDRREAIREALAAATGGDVVVIAGKGHEKTQDLGGTVVDFDDRVVARALLEETT